MKIKKLIIPLLLLIVCMFAFSACSNGTLNFDENSTVKLTYTCTDEEKDFEAELNAEQSRNFIFSLNKISYSEVIDKDILFSPSYDSLTIEINNESVRLHDVGYKMKYGGYFYLNGKLCESKENFGFLEPYLAEYRPDNSVSFEVQYVKSGVGSEENYQIIKSVDELNNYIATEKQNIDLSDFVLFNDEVISKYNDEYFANSFIVIFMKEVSSGSFNFRVDNVYVNGDRLIVHYEIFLPGDYKDGEIVDVTCDMAYWYSFVELSNEYSSIRSVDLISLK